VEDNTRYLIQVRYTESKEVEEMVLETDRLDWSMEQYQRNRQPFTWRVVEKNLPKRLIDKIQGK
jgi:regulation of enolase protein 1 (concanavalin A-like superfamily)|tara:strand:- start:1777 stop:1968 length:192 start_codon:yes stop_codon:yes gene_type:complete